MRTTTEMDSICPSYYPLIWKAAVILTMTNATQKMDVTAWMMFPVATKRMTKAKETEIAIPYIAFWTSILSEGM